MSRAENVAIATQLRRDGFKLAEIAEAMNVSPQTVSGWINDPDLAKQKARRARYAGVCVDCGKPTDGSSGPGRAPTRCVPCVNAYRSIWTRDSIVAAMQAWHAEHGEPPTALDWNPHDRRWGRGTLAERKRRHLGYPYVSSVLKAFGTWNAAIAAAGFEPLKIGGKRHQRRRAA